MKKTFTSVDWQLQSAEISLQVKTETDGHSNLLNFHILALSSVTPSIHNSQFVIGQLLPSLHIKHSVLRSAQVV